MLKTGARLRSQVCTTEAIVIRADKPSATLNCGGHPMVEIGEAVTEGLSLDDGFVEGNAIGKRYCDAEGAVEILVTKPGDGSLALGDQRLEIKAAQPLPSSD